MPTPDSRHEPGLARVPRPVGQLEVHVGVARLAHPTPAAKVLASQLLQVLQDHKPGRIGDTCKPQLLSSCEPTPECRHGNPAGVNQVGTRALRVRRAAVLQRSEVVDEAVLGAAHPGETHRTGLRHGELVHGVDDDAYLRPCVSTFDV